jgi:hypothetical protein
MSDGIPYTTVIAVCRSYGFVECNHYDQHRNARRWRAAIRRACKKGLLKRVKGSTPSRTRYRLAETPNG